MSRSTIFKVAAAAIAAGTLSGCGYPIADYKAVGNVVSAGNHGLTCKPFAGELALATVRGGRAAGKTTTTIDFAAANDDIAKKLTDALEKQTPVEVSIHKVLMQGWFNCYQYEDDVVTDVKVLDKTIASGISFGGVSSLAPADIDDNDVDIVPGKDVELACRVKKPTTPAPAAAPK